MALKLLPEELADVPAAVRDRYEAQAGRYWDLFYRRNTNKFFKDRHYLHKEFPDVAAGPATLLEVGCGVGNTVFPLYETNPSLRIFCCDFAPSAIELVRQNPAYGAAGGAVQAFVADITKDLLAAPSEEGGCGVPEGGCDLATMVFVLSAIHPQRMAAAVHNVARCLRPGSGRLLFRDYAEGDLAQERLAGGDRPKRLGPNFYVRGDGTRCYYFGQDEVVALFASAGFVCDSLALHERTVVNHKRDIAMDRRWLQAGRGPGWGGEATFTLKEPRPPPLPLRELLAQPPPVHDASHAPSYTAQPPTAASCSATVSGDVDMDAAEAVLRESLPLPHDLAPPQPQPGAPAPAAAPLPGFGTPPPPRVRTSPPQPATGAGPAAELTGSPGLLGGGSTWLTGAAGRLASHLAAGPGLPSGRALLPDTLDSADDLAAELSPSPRHASHAPHAHSGGHGGHAPFGSAHAPSSGGHHSGPLHASRLAAASTGGGDGGEAGMDWEASGGGGGGGGSGAGSGQGRRRQRSPGAEGGDAGAVDAAAAAAEVAAAGALRSLEQELEAEFFATIGRDSSEVAAEVAATGAALSRVRLADVAEVAAARLAAVPAAFGAAAAKPAPAPAAVAAAPTVAVGTASTVEVEVPVGPSVSFRCLCGLSPETGSPHLPAASLALARLFLASPRLLAGRCALQLGPATPSTSAPITTAAAGVLPAMVAVRAAARRIVVTDGGRDGLAAAAADLRRNSSRIVIERLRLAPLDWLGMGAASAAAAGAATGAAGYTYVSGPVRQLRDVLQMHPGGYDIVYGVDPLAGVTTSAGAPGASADAPVQAARALFDVAAQLLHPSAGGPASRAAAAGSGGDHVAACAGPQAGRLLLLAFPGEWAAAHGLGLAALAGMCGWELLAPEQLEEAHGVDAAAAAAVGCAAMVFRRRPGVGPQHVLLDVRCAGG
ncbi:hypothetical protein HYH03_012725 [Edaphochlamys debaryana]|uniref:Methyltransferase type 12 domain-containing protein n=1 Tax=Edaphochlamys debaryana TaxID=47281 RepID=A0A836BTU6_9CHLO|nr:hypothetical protein HYH03_012725 [Edaphochlamys debaryana]|eukprot:KAG2488725.1 hypothetical protein HYH03_012725 [Edaphochlamys debaryana]